MTLPVPYYQDDAVTIYHGDCRDILPGINGVNLFFTSPPYNQSLEKFRASGMHKETKWVDRISTSYFDSINEIDYQRQQIEIIDLCYESSADDGSIFYNHKLRYRDTVPIFPINWISKTKWTV